MGGREGKRGLGKIGEELAEVVRDDVAVLENGNYDGRKQAQAQYTPAPVVPAAAQTHGGIHLEVGRERKKEG